MYVWSSMQQTNLQTLKGFRDFLPKEAKKRNQVIEILKKTFELFGFEPLETPALEYQEVLLGKYGPEADKMVFAFEDKGGRSVALKYDQTVPTSRVLSMYHRELAMPFRRYQIQPVWRAEKPQLGRFREFTQADADIYGSTSVLADAEIISLANSLYINLGFSNFKIYVNDRKILFELMAFASIPEKLHLSTIVAIDKLDRKSTEEIKSELNTNGLSEASIEHLFHHMQEAKPTKRLAEVIKAAKKLGVEADKILFQARLARGLDYYTSTIFEIKIEDYKAGSVLGGGRYDNLIRELSGVDIPAVGFAVGFDRTLEAMDQIKLFSEAKRDGVLIAVFSPELMENSELLVERLRSSSIACELFPDEQQDLKKQLKYADKKGVRWFIVIGPDEIKKKSAIVKDLENGHLEEVKVENLIKKLTHESSTS